ncbi:hypothetical protein PaeBR_19950 [Paenibacillus sp. BR2-3]|uniref:hypothetical protein n=1 Tax=Paenibacillus sp. BR2-3 TaxID=3048494 RepID=UPI003977D7CD
MLLKWKKVSILGLVILLFLLTGCAKGTAHVNVQMNGNVDIAVILRLDSRTQSLINGTMEESLINKLQAVGIQIEKRQDSKFTEYQYLKSYTSQEIKSMVPHTDSEFIDSNVKTAETWFYSKYNVETQLNLSKYSDKIVQSIENLNVPKPLVRLLMQSFTFDFKLTLPVNLFGANNAAEQDGRTLTWHINLADPEPIRMVIYVPKIRNIAIAAGSGIIVLGGVVVYFVRRRRRRRRFF